jgi:hypothetical protein
MGRIESGVDAGRLVVLRDAPVHEEARFTNLFERVKPMAHPAVAKVLEVIQGPSTLCLVSEYVEGVTLFELLRTAERQGICIPVAVATRVVHEALLAADQIDALLGDVLKPRYLFSDTIWMAEYGAILISEPGLADALHPPVLEKRGFRVKPVSAELLDTREAGRLLAQLVVGSSAEVVPGALDARLPVEIARVVKESVTRGYSHRCLMAQALEFLPPGLLGGESDVAECVRSLFGVTLEMRRHRAIPLDSICDKPAHDDATACLSLGALTGSGTMPSLRALEPVSGKRVIVPATAPLTAHSAADAAAPSVLTPAVADDDVDDDVATTAFRPSRIPLPSGRRPRQQTPLPAPRPIPASSLAPSRRGDSLVAAPEAASLVTADIHHAVPQELELAASQVSDAEESGRVTVERPAVRQRPSFAELDLVVIHEPTLITRRPKPRVSQRSVVALVWLLVVALAVWLLLLSR